MSCPSVCAALPPSCAAAVRDRVFRRRSLAVFVILLAVVVGLTGCRRRSKIGKLLRGKRDKSEEKEEREEKKVYGLNPTAAVPLSLVPSPRFPGGVMRPAGTGLYSMTISGNGLMLMTTDTSDTLRLWDMEKGTCLRTLQLAEGQVGCALDAAISHDGRVVMFAGPQPAGGITMWNTAAHKPIKMMAGAGKHTFQVACTPDAKFAFAGDHDGVLHVVQVATGATVRTLRASEAGSGDSTELESFAISADARVAMGHTPFSPLRVWTTGDGKTLYSLTGEDDPVVCSALSATGGRAVAGTHEDNLLLFDLFPAPVTRKVQAHSEYGIAAVAMTPDSRRVLTMCVTMPDQSGLVTLARMIKARKSSEPYTPMKSVVGLWDFASGESLAVLQPKKFVERMAISPDGSRVLLGYLDGEIQAMDVISPVAKAGKP